MGNEVAQQVDPTKSAEADLASAGEQGDVPGFALSPSRAADFMTCPLLYRFRTIDKLPEPPSPEATRGTVVHSVLERLFELPAADRTPVQAISMVRPQWEELLEAEPSVASLFADDADGSALTTWLTSAEHLVEKYFGLENPQHLEPRDRELYVETTLDSGLTLRGYVDRVDVAPASGDIRVVDYKTGKAPREGFEQRAMFQMRFYALVLWRIHGQVPRLLQLIYLGSGEVLRYEPDANDLLQTERKLRALWRAIERAISTGDWRPSPSKLCDWCAHHDLCPAWGGVPPPLPDTLPSSSAGDEAPSPRTSGADV
jgi:putative RecB family exonuclease